MCWQEHYQCCSQQPLPPLLVLFPLKAAVRVTFESGRAQKLALQLCLSLGFLGGKALGIPWHLVHTLIVIPLTRASILCLFISPPTPDFRLLRVETALFWILTAQVCLAKSGYLLNVYWMMNERADSTGWRHNVLPPSLVYTSPSTCSITLSPRAFLVVSIQLCSPLKWVLWSSQAKSEKMAAILSRISLRAKHYYYLQHPDFFTFTPAHMDPHSGLP